MNSSKGSKVVPNIQEEVPFERIALLRIGAKTRFLRFEKSTQVDVFEKFVWLRNGLCQYEQSGEIASGRLLLRHVGKKMKAGVCGHLFYPIVPGRIPGKRQRLSVKEKVSYQKFSIQK